MEYIIKRLMENKRLNESSVGSFYCLGDNLVYDIQDLDKADDGSDFINWGSHWDIWSVFTLIYPEYDELDDPYYFPRGRLVYNKETQRYILYLDRKMRNRTMINKILDIYGVKENEYDIGEDEHYQSSQPLSDIVPDEIESDINIRRIINRHGITESVYNGLPSVRRLWQRKLRREYRRIIR